MACFCPSWKIDSWTRLNILSDVRIDIAEYLAHHGDAIKEELSARYVECRMLAGVTFATFKAAVLNELVKILSVALNLDIQTVYENLDSELAERVLGKDYFQF